MNDREQERFEAELRRNAPARLPDQFMAKLKTANPGAKPVVRERRAAVVVMPDWWRAWRWLAPALAVAVVGFLIVRANLPGGDSVKKTPLAITYGIKPDGVQVDQELISSFDVVARLPGGEPVRFHCQKWNDQLRVTDPSNGMEVEQSSPRIEVVPVRFETY